MSESSASKEPVSVTEGTAGAGPSNFEIALKAEAKRVTRCFQPYSSEARANHAASHRLGHQQRIRTGEYFYTHPDMPGVAFSSRGRAAHAAVTRADVSPASPSGPTKTVERR